MHSRTHTERNRSIFLAKGGLEWGKAGWQSTLARAPDGHTHVPTLVP